MGEVIVLRGISPAGPKGRPSTAQGKATREAQPLPLRRPGLKGCFEFEALKGRTRNASVDRDVG